MTDVQKNIKVVMCLPTFCSKLICTYKKPVPPNACKYSCSENNYQMAI